MNKPRGRKEEKKKKRGVTERREGARQRDQCVHIGVKHLCESLCMSAAVCVSVPICERKRRAKRQ